MIFCEAFKILKAKMCWMHNACPDGLESLRYRVPLGTVTPLLLRAGSLSWRGNPYS